MAAPFPHTYRITVERTGMQSGVLRGPERLDVVTGPPPEFDGRDDWWSPEQLLLAAVGACYEATFLAIARKARLEIESFRAEVEGRVDKAADGVSMVDVAIRARIRVAPADVARAETLAQTAKKHCIVSRSLKADATLEVDIAADRVAPADTQ